jgi:hypothetical protein
MWVWWKKWAFGLEMRGKWAIGPSCTYNEPLHKSKAKKCKFFFYFGAHYMAPAPSQVSLVGRLDNRTWDNGIARPSSNAVRAKKKGYNWAWETPISGWAGRKGMRCPLLVWHANLLLLGTNGQNPFQKGASTQRRGAVDMPNFDSKAPSWSTGKWSSSARFKHYVSYFCSVNSCQDK